MCSELVHTPPQVAARRPGGGDLLQQAAEACAEAARAKRAKANHGHGPLLIDAFCCSVVL